jgi:hypothetical protein
MNTGKSVRHAERLQEDDFENECVRGSVLSRYQQVDGTGALTLTAIAIRIVTKNLHE